MEQKIFTDFVEEGLSAESKQRYGPAVSNYYKALTFLCSYLIQNKLRKIPTNHNEIFLFLKVSFPKVHEVVDGVFSIYRESYDHLLSKEDCVRLKHALKTVAKLGNIEKEFAEDLKKI
jgi:hypothetical protein